MIPVIAILCITGLEITALANDINGALLAAAIGLIAGLGGYEVKRRQKPK
ncbi:hypothetical protein ES708_25840 [subsurface metagenome]